MGPGNKTELEIQLQVITAVATNLVMTPGMVALWRQRRAPEFFLGFFTFVSSFTYHYLDTWHKLDNVFAITSFCYLLIMVTQYRDVRKEQCAQFAFFCIVIVLQEISPWNELFTVLPILAAFALFAAERLKLGSWPSLDAACMKRAFVSLIVAIFCFIRGLDDNNDYLRIFHGLWHSFVGLFLFYTIQANAAFTAKRNAQLDKLSFYDSKFTL